MSFIFFKKSKQGGFTLIEMLTVIAIFTIITSIILFNLPSFQGTTNLDLVAQEVSLHIRGAQLYTTATRSSGVANDTFLSYGLHFDLSSNTSRSSFGLFTVGDSARSETTRYKKQADSVDRPVEVYRLPRGYEISKVCVGDNATCAGPGVGSTAACYNSSTDNRFLDIVFIRPNPEPHVCIYPSAVHPDDCVNSTPFSARAIVCVKASRVGLERMIEINKGGQIRINK